MKRPSPAQQQRLVDAWTHPAGTPVEVRLDDGTTKQTKTRSEAWLLGGHTAVVMLDGISGCYALSRVSAIPTDPGAGMPPEALVIVARRNAAALRGKKE